MTRRYELGRYAGKRGPYKTHAYGDGVLTLCGLSVTQGSEAKGFEKLPLASRRDQVSCGNCLKKIYADFVL